MIDMTFLFWFIYIQAGLGSAFASLFIHSEETPLDRAGCALVYFIFWPAFLVAFILLWIADEKDDRKC